jgi:phosphate transport system permease protein
MLPDSPRRQARRVRRTSPAVRLADVAARWIISVVGIGTIAVVTGLCVFLVWAAAPLFRGAQVEAAGALEQRAPAPSTALATDERVELAWSVEPDGALELFALPDGASRKRLTPLDAAPSAMSVTTALGELTFGFPDGTLRTGSVRFEVGFHEPAELALDEATRARLAAGESAWTGAGIATPLPDGRVRLETFDCVLAEPLSVAPGRELVRVDRAGPEAAPVLAALDAQGVLHLSRASKRKNLLTGKETVALTSGTLDLGLDGREPPRWMFLSGLGDMLFLVWEDGSLWRVLARDLAAAAVVEKTSVLESDAERVSAAAMLLGRTTLLIGDSRGRVGTWFTSRPPDGGTPDGTLMARSHVFAGPSSPVVALAGSARARLFAAAHADGALRLVHVTSGKELLDQSFAAGAPQRLALAPRDDALLVLGERGGGLWRVHAPHPETTLAALFLPVWYEGYLGAEHVWQSSSGTDDFEPKYGLVPLVFGTLKATVYSLLFGVPLALLAAIYTSEFLHPRHKARIKPTIEMMASLPSVVLGFIAALVVAPYVEGRVPQVLLAILLLPAALLCGGHLWRAAPTVWTQRFARARLPVIALCLVGAVTAGAAWGDAFERALFAGDIKAWLSGARGRASGGWFVLLLPLAAVLVGWLRVRHIDARLTRLASAQSRQGFVLVDLLAFLAGTLTVLGLAWGGALALEALGLDARGGVFGTYVQRNALVVGFAMGFAIVPIIYTIAEDALAAVPDHLRAASLGAGATPWQTAVRVVVPAAMSGLFSAVMVGLGRAVGETMIVLMATGNTAILDWNVFNGFRTLAANIAYEMSEAVQGSTHYRLLFLAALVLFAMTFVLNTVAETVRQRYRRRRVQL